MSKILNLLFVLTLSNIIYPNVDNAHDNNIWSLNLSNPTLIETAEKIILGNDYELSYVVTTSQQSSSCTLEVSPSNQSASKVAGTVDFYINTNCSWAAESDQAWCTVTPSGNESGKLTVNFEENNTNQIRIATLTVTVENESPIMVTVTQNSETCSLELSQTSLIVFNDTGFTTLFIQTNCHWTAESDQTWCNVTQSGNGDSDIVINYAENLTGIERTATITVKAGIRIKQFTLVQWKHAFPNPSQSLNPGAPPIHASLQNEGEDHWYRLPTPDGTWSGSQYTIQTYGNTDTYMEFYHFYHYFPGEESPEMRLIEENDNGGTGSNAMIITREDHYRFSQYFLRVRGANLNTTGDYSIDINHCAGAKNAYDSSSYNSTRQAILPYTFGVSYCWINSVSIYHNGGTGNVKIGIYSDSSNGPEHLLGVTEPIAINSDEGWQTIPLKNRVVIDGEKYVWLAWVFENNPGVRFREGEVEGFRSVSSSGSWEDGMPSTFGQATHNDQTYSVFFTFTNISESLNFSVSQTNIDLDSHSQAEKKLNITTNTSWHITNDAEWLEATPTFGTNDALITLKANSENADPMPRTATVSIFPAGFEPVVIKVKQETVHPYLSITPATQNVPPIPASTTSFSISSNSDWTASSDQDWCTVTSSGSGDGTITANYEENTSAAKRTATITVSVDGLDPVQVNVTQATANPVLTVTPANQSIPASPAGSTSFTVTSNSDWTASSDQYWCTVTSSGSGDGTITANFEENISISKRTATITVSVDGLEPVKVTLLQSNEIPYISISPNNQNVASISGQTNYSILTNTDWTASSDQYWCTVTSSGKGDGSIIANYEVNESNIERTALITVSANGLPPLTVSLTQEEHLELVSIDITTLDTIKENSIINIACIATYSNNSTEDITGSTTWSVSNCDNFLRFTNTNGKIEALQMNEKIVDCNITAEYKGLRDTFKMVITDISNVNYNLSSIPRIYPNPFNTNLIIDLNDLISKDWQITIFDTYGRKIKEFPADQYNDLKQLEWDATDQNGSRVKTGLYFIRFTNDNKCNTFKVSYIEDP